MQRRLTISSPILVCALLLIPCIATAQASGQAGLAAWLSRLVGHFTVQVQGTSQAQGTGECRTVGSGPGVSCLFTILGPDGQRAPGMPQLMLVGLGTGDQSIQLLQLDLGEPAISARGSLRADTVVFTSNCPNRAMAPAPTVSCDRIVSILAAPDNQSIEISLEWNAALRASSGFAHADIRLVLRRESR